MALFAPAGGDRAPSFPPGANRIKVSFHHGGVAAACGGPPSIEGLQSLRIVLPTVTIPVDTELRPMVAFYLCSQPVLLTSSAGCQNYAYYVNDATSRARWAVMLLEDNGEADPPEIHFEIRTATGCRAEVAFDGIYDPPSFVAAHGLLVQVSGLLAQEWQLWARVVPDLARDPQRPVRAVFEATTDRLGAVREDVLGMYTTGGPP